MAHYIGYVSTEWAKRADGRNTVFAIGSDENAARDRAEALLGAQEGELGTNIDTKGWVFETLSDQEGFAEGLFISADGHGNQNRGA